MSQFQGEGDEATGSNSEPAQRAPVWILLKTPRGEKLHRIVAPSDWTVAHIKDEYRTYCEPEGFQATSELVYKSRVLHAEEMIANVVGEDLDPVIEVINADEQLLRREQPEGERPVEPRADLQQEKQDASELVASVSRRKTDVEVRGEDEEVEVTLGFDNGDVQKITARTVNDVKTQASKLCRTRGLILDDILLDSQSILKFGGKVLTKDVVGADADRILQVVTVSHHESSSENSSTGSRASSPSLLGKPQVSSSEIFVDMLFEAQADKDRIGHINQMAYNNKVITVALMAMGDQVNQLYPALQDDLLRLIRHQNEVTDLMKLALEKNSLFRDQPSTSDGIASRRLDVSTTERWARELRQLQHLPPRERPAQPVAAPAAVAQRGAGGAVAEAAPNARGRAAPPPGAGIAARVPRVAALIVIDVRLLFKLALVVAVLGHDAGQKEFYMICFIATVVYLANTNMIRIPLLARLNLRGIGRIPRAERRGFLLDVWTMISTFFLSIIPAWQVIGEEIPIDQQQVRPVAADQPAVAAPAVVL